MGRSTKVTVIVAEPATASSEGQSSETRKFLQRGRPGQKSNNFVAVVWKKVYAPSLRNTNHLEWKSNTVVCYVYVYAPKKWGSHRHSSRLPTAADAGTPLLLNHLLLGPRWPSFPFPRTSAFWIPRNWLELSAYVPSWHALRLTVSLWLVKV